MFEQYIHVWTHFCLIVLSHIVRLKCSLFVVCVCAVDTLTGFLALDWWHIWIGLIQQPFSSHMLAYTHSYSLLCATHCLLFLTHRQLRLDYLFVMASPAPWWQWGLNMRFFKRISSLFLLLKKESFLISSSRIHHHPSLLSSAANYTADHLLQGYKCSFQHKY